MSEGITRRETLRRTALVAGATLWTAPVVQSIGTPAFAAGSPGVCFGCLTGGGQEVTDGSLTTYQGGSTIGSTVLAGISFGLSPICCDKRPGTELEVNAHPAGANGPHSDKSWHFDENLQVTCTREGDPEMPRACANVFTGTIEQRSATGTLEFTLQFRLADLGEGPRGEEGGNLDTVKLTITDAQGRVVVLADGTLDRGNLQAHEDLGPGHQDLPTPQVVCNCG